MDNQLLTGTVQSGGTDDVRLLSGTVVTLYEAREGTPVKIGSATTDRAGEFSLPAPLNAADSIFYATASLGGGVLLATIIGPEIGGAITINELTTVAAAFSMAQFTEHSTISGNAFGLRIAAGMSDNLASPLTGASSEVLLNPPNADQTIALRSTRALANLLAPCVRQQPGAWDTLRALATPPGGAQPADTFQALVSIARNPANNVDAIYQQAQALEIYLPSLEGPPDAWTLAVKVNDSGSDVGDDKRMFGGPANLVFDRNGYAWIANNVFQGTPNSGDFIIVLQPNGKPADGTNGTPKSPVRGGGLNGPGLGIDIDANGNVWVGNFGWGPKTEFPVAGSVSKFDATGNAPEPDPHLGGTHRVQSTVVDGHNNLWLASFGNDSVVVFPDGDSRHAFGYPQYRVGGRNPPEGPSQEAPGTGTFGIAIDPVEERTAWVTYSSGLGWPQANPGTLARFRIENGALHLEHSLAVGAGIKTVAADSHGNAWVASGGDSSVYMVTREREVTRFHHRGGIDHPWGIAVDGNDDVWVGNFGPMGVTEDYTTAGITHLAGVNSPSGLAVGEAISPETGYTLPNAGDPILLHNGDPLYDHGECYSPLMRQTSVTIDQAGNVWAVNNWKPRFGTDFPPKHGNPGGDGIVIFVGLAKPPARRTDPSS